MVYEVLARKWRPQIFEDVIGQEHITQTLQNAIKGDRLAHGYLFSGARGVGKTSVARILAKAINCIEGEVGVPCNTCHSCTEITTGASVDVQEIDGASNRGIDEIRELRENIKYMPASSRYRVYIIDEVHMLTLPAFNALLKTLEEPPPHVKFIFATTEPHKVPVTILSRCQKFDFKRIPLGLILKQLEKITGEEGIEMSQTGMTLIAREAEGSMRDAESLLDQVVSFAGPKVEDNNITDILGIIDRALLFETSLAIIENSPEKCMQIVHRIYNYGYDIKEYYRALMDQFRNLMISLITSKDDLLDMSDRDREEIKRQAQMAGLERLQQSLNLLIFREEDLRFTFHPRLVLETIMINLCRLGDDLSFDQLIKKLEALEKRLSTSAPSTHRATLGNLSEPGLNWDTGNSESNESNAPIHEKKSGDWDNLLNYLSSKNRAMANVLKEWHFLNLLNDTLELACGGNPFSTGYFDEPDRIEKLAGYCKDFFKRDIKIKIVKQKKNEIQKTSLPKKEETSPGVIKDSQLPSHVQEVLKIFQGEVKGEVSLDSSESKNKEKQVNSRREKI
jgi:DNA polymerase-3 subunit gamma/tau